MVMVTLRATASAAALLTASVALAGCASHGKGTPELVKGITAVSSSPSPSLWIYTPPPGSSTPCTVYLYGDDARVSVTSTDGSTPAGECRSLATSLSGGGAFWTLQTITPRNTPSVVCALEKDQWVIVVRDDGGQIYGQSLCSNLPQNGWSEDTSAEQQARSQDAQAAQQQADAQASASAAAAQASARAADESSAQQDLGNLQTDLNGFTNAQKVRDDVTTTDNDLARERQDAANGNGDQCINASTTVYNDAATTIYNDVLTSGYNDSDNEETGIQQLRKEVSAVQSDESTLRNDGLQLLSGMDDAISAGQQQAAEAVATTNKAIDQLNADLASAYQVANSAGTGDCANDGPGAAPSGLSHIS